MIDLQFDKKHLWHPYAPAINSAKVYPVLSANGCKIYLDTGEELVDGVGSWWSAIHGYSHPILVDALSNQAKKMSHVMFGGLTHSPAIELGKKLLELLGKNFSHVFFADGGSVAVEIAMKTAIQYQCNKNLYKKTKFLSFKNAYHGDTGLAMSVCDTTDGMHSTFINVIQKQIFAPAPPLGFSAEITDDDFLPILKIVQKKHREIAAVIIEPIVQCAGGMRIYSPKFLKKIRELCDEYNLILICDEIATGFGRTGVMFAVEHADITPDIICVGKALTGGTMTLAAMVTTSKVAQTVCKNNMPLMHGPTFMANPLACTVSRANLDLLTSWDWQEKVKNIENYLNENLKSLSNNLNVADVRVLGAMGAIEMKEKIDVSKFQNDCISRGAWIRPLGKVAYVMPSFVISYEELKTLTDALKFAVLQS
ncbi:MAG: adenosylmethionine--8-amino-7-oxononanoate transaminase [Chitinispirillales bacterium]|jgi:adenosylmethionine-8-amino-7-oxononanoate aminotransferase|nr:adenosylmethionine--8-amino-7-oxononanoate transaminase [Chitinispirillales bacterium]